jgi:hypothetical protein
MMQIDPPDIVAEKKFLKESFNEYSGNTKNYKNVGGLSKSKKRAKDAVVNIITT